MSIETPMIWRFMGLGLRAGEPVFGVHEVKQPSLLVLEWEQQEDSFHVLWAFGGLKIACVHRIGDVWTGFLMEGLIRGECIGVVPTMEEAMRLTYDMAVTAIEADRNLCIWSTGESWEERKARFNKVGR